MPELPEVEVVRQSLNKKIKYEKVKKVIVRNTNLRVLCSTCSKLSVVLSHYLDNDTTKVLTEDDKLDDDKKADILAFYYKLKDNHEKIVNYFNNYEIYLSKTPLKSFTKGVINHKF